MRDTLVSPQGTSLRRICKQQEKRRLLLEKNIKELSFAPVPHATYGIERIAYSHGQYCREFETAQEQVLEVMHAMNLLPCCLGCTQLGVPGRSMPKRAEPMPHYSV